jgi:hypothetical protein
MKKMVFISNHGQKIKKIHKKLAKDASLKPQMINRFMKKKGRWKKKKEKKGLIVMN